MNTTDLWEMLGDLEAGQSLEVLTQLFVRYEQRFRHNPQDPESVAFFRHLAVILAQVQSCNLNRR